MNYRILRVPPHSPEQVRSRVFRLRQEVYVGEFGYPMRCAGEPLSDSLDDYSVSFILEGETGDIGTIRHTSRSRGPIETEMQDETWRNCILDEAIDKRLNISEVSRYMVKKPYRGGIAAPILIYAAFQEWLAEGIDIAFFGARVGASVRYYQRYLANNHPVPPKPYWLYHFNFGECQLMSWDRSIAYPKLYEVLFRQIFPILGTADNLPLR